MEEHLPGHSVYGICHSHLKHSKLFPFRACCWDFACPSCAHDATAQAEPGTGGWFLPRRCSRQKPGWTYHHVLLASLSVAAGRVAAPRHTGHVSWNNPFLHYFMSLPCLCTFFARFFTRLPIPLCTSVYTNMFLEEDLISCAAPRFLVCLSLHNWLFGKAFPSHLSCHSSVKHYEDSEQVFLMYRSIFSVSS